MKRQMVWRRGAILWVAPCLALLALLGGSAHARAQNAALLDATPADAAPLDGSICPWGRVCHSPSESDVTAGGAEAAVGPVRLPQGDFTRATFASLRDGNYEIYVARGDGVQEYNITRNPAADMEPMLSPDGSQIAFVSNRDHPTPSSKPRIYNLYVANWDGSNVRRLTNNEYTQRRPAWSPDGSHIIFGMVVLGNAEIYSIRSDGADLRRLTEDAAVDFDPVYTFDGSAILWVRKVSDTHAVIMRAHSDGSGAYWFTQPIRYLQHLMIAPMRPILGYESDRNADGWMDFSLVNPDNASEVLAYGCEGAWLRDCALGGWSPAIADGWGGQDSAIAVDERSFFVISWWYRLDDGKHKLVLAGLTTIGSFGWANGYVVSSSKWDFDFNSVSLDQVAPTAAVGAPPLIHRNARGVVYKLADAGGAGVAYAEWRFDSAAGEIGIAPKVVLASAGTGTTYALGDEGLPVAVRVRAWDLAGNLSAWSAPAHTTSYGDGLACTLTDLRAVPVTGAALSFEGQQPFLNQPSDTRGVANAYFAYATAPWTIQGSHPAFGSATFASWQPAISPGQDPVHEMHDLCRAYFYDDAHNAIRNGHMDMQGASGWRLSCSSILSGGSLLLASHLSDNPCDYGYAGTIHASQAVPAAATAAMHKPTLSFLYHSTRIDGRETPTGKPFWPLRVLIAERKPVSGATDKEVTASDAVTVTQVYLESSVQEGTQFAWADLSPWAGRAITVTFELSRGEPLLWRIVYIHVDEVSITSWKTPVVRTVAYAPVAAASAAEAEAGVAATLLITGENFITTPTVSLVANMPAPVTLALSAPPTETLLRAALPKGLAPGRYRVCVTNPGGLYTEMDVNINLPQSLYLPAVAKYHWPWPLWSPSQ